MTRPAANPAHGRTHAEAPTADSRAVEEGLAIGAICSRTGLSARTVRYYEELGLLPGVRRRAGGRRVYGADELERLRFIGRLKALGLSLLEIKELNELYADAGSTRAMLVRLRALLDGHLEQVSGRIRALRDLEIQMTRYRTHVAERIDDTGRAPGTPKSDSVEEN